jgi:N-acetylglutamate synthase-like GNAT family acetyltransferase
MKALVDIYSGKILLEKNLVTLYEAVQEFWIAEIDGELIGCGALHVLWSDLGEIRTIAVRASDTRSWSACSMWPGNCTSSASSC